MAAIAVIGTGRMGGALAGRLTELGHDVVCGSRDPDSESAQQVAAKNPKISCVDIEVAAHHAQWIILAVPYHALVVTLASLGELDNKLVIDVTNALRPDGNGLVELASTTSSGEEIQKALPKAKIIKAFNTVGFHVIRDPDVLGGKVSTLVAGDDRQAKSEVIRLAQSMGLTTADVGPLRQSRYLEGMVALYLAPYLEGRVDEAFEFYVRSGSSPKHSSGVRAAR